MKSSTSQVSFIASVIRHDICVLIRHSPLSIQNLNSQRRCLQSGFTQLRPWSHLYGQRECNVQLRMQKRVRIENNIKTKKTKKNQKKKKTIIGVFFLLLLFRRKLAFFPLSLTGFKNKQRNVHLFLLPFSYYGDGRQCIPSVPSQPLNGIIHRHDFLNLASGLSDAQFVYFENWDSPGNDLAHANMVWMMIIIMMMIMMIWFFFFCFFCCCAASSVE